MRATREHLNYLRPSYSTRRGRWSAPHGRPTWLSFIVVFAGVLCSSCSWWNLPLNPCWKCWLVRAVTLQARCLLCLTVWLDLSLFGCRPSCDRVSASVAHCSRYFSLLPSVFTLSPLSDFCSAFSCFWWDLVYAVDFVPRWQHWYLSL